MITRPDPVIIQGGMGAAVSSWRLARAVAETGQMGVVSGTALDVVLARRLQLGDPDEVLRFALAEFPLPGMAERVLSRFFIPGGKSPDAPFLPSPMPSAKPSQAQLELLVVANFVEVFLAKRGHPGCIGINYLEKIQTPTLPSLLGAMLADADYVLMGAGIPRAIPGVLDRLAVGQAAELTLDVQDARESDRYAIRFDPRAFAGGFLPRLKRPRFLAIVASATLATMLARKASGRVDGFVVEGPTAGGHNAPPRGAMQLNERGEPVYGPRDAPDLSTFRALKRPFWLAGSYDTPQRLQAALAAGASGVQVGTAFAFCHESGLRTDIKQRVIEMSCRETVDVRTDPNASPTGFPFKVLPLDGISGDPTQRRRLCDLGYLRCAYRKDDGQLGWRCRAEDVATYVGKGGCESDTVGRKCLCNALLANVGLEQIRGSGRRELPLVTSGDAAKDLRRLLPGPAAEGYSARDVVNYLQSAST